LPLPTLLFRKKKCYFYLKWLIRFVKNPYIGLAKMYAIFEWKSAKKKKS
jgi:hypothetical protein